MKIDLNKLTEDERIKLSYRMIRNRDGNPVVGEFLGVCPICWYAIDTFEVGGRLPTVNGVPAHRTCVFNPPPGTVFTTARKEDDPIRKHLPK